MFWGSEGDWQHNRDRDSLQCQHIIRDQIRWHDEAGAALIVTLQWQVINNYLVLLGWLEYLCCSLIGWWNIIRISDWLTGTRLWWHQSHLLEWWTWAGWCRVFASPDPATDNTLWPPSPLSSSLSSSWVSSSVSTDRWAENQSSCAERIDNVELQKKIEKL